MLLIREEKSEDSAAIHRLNEVAFGQQEEADLVDALREAGALNYSLVAVLDNSIVGHLAFSPVVIDNGRLKFHGLGLAPMSVHPDHQRTGIGKSMIRYWLKHCARESDNLVVVVGHPSYYPQFGFIPAKKHGIYWEHDVPEEVFMVLELRKGALEEIQGVVRFHEAFDDV